MQSTLKAATNFRQTSNSRQKGQNVEEVLVLSTSSGLF